MFILGLLRAIGVHLFKVNVQSSVKSQESIFMVDGTKMDHVTFEVKLDAMTSSVTNLRQNTLTPEVINSANIPWLFSAETFCSVFPYHIIFDKDLIICQAGTGVQKLLSVPSIIGTSLDKLFTLEHPYVSMVVDQMLEFLNAIFLLRVKKNPDFARPGVLLKGLYFLIYYGHSVIKSSPEWIKICKSNQSRLI